MFISYNLFNIISCAIYKIYKLHIPDEIIELVKVNMMKGKSKVIIARNQTADEAINFP